MNRPMTIDGTPLITSAMKRVTAASLPFAPYSCR